MTTSNSPSIEEQIQAAIVERFFSSAPVMNKVWRNDSQGHMYEAYEPGYSHSPMQIIASKIYESRMQEIIAAVQDRITLDAIVDAIVPKIVEQFVQIFSTRNDSSWQKPGEDARRKMNDMVWERVADEFGKQAVAYLQRTGGLNPVLGSVEDVR